MNKLFPYLTCHSLSISLNNQANRVLKPLVLLFAFLLSVGIAQAQCPPGSLTLTPNASNTVTNGKVYCVASNTSILNLTINPGGKVIILPGVKLTGSGSFTIDGILEVGEYGSIELTGSTSFGFIPNNNPSIILHEKAYFSMTGSLTQYDVTQSGYYPTMKSQVEMAAGSILEVCATYSHYSKYYPAIKYTGAPSLKAYFVVKNQASGAGVGTNVSNESQVVWIAMDAVSNLYKGNATYLRAFCNSRHML